MNNYKTVDEFLNDQTVAKRAQIVLLREIIISTAPELVESIKWNAPNYIFNGEDRITFNVLNKDNSVKLVFHMGALRKEDKKGKPITVDGAQLLEWASDIPGYATFRSLDDIKLRESVLRNFILSWLALK